MDGSSILTIEKEVILQGKPFLVLEPLCILSSLIIDKFEGISIGGMEWSFGDSGDNE